MWLNEAIVRSEHEAATTKILPRRKSKYSHSYRVEVWGYREAPHYHIKVVDIDSGKVEVSKDVNSIGDIDYIMRQHGAGTNSDWQPLKV